MWPVRDATGVLGGSATRSVFVDGTGRRRRIATFAGGLVAVALAGSLALLGAGLFASGGGALPGWPEFGGGGQHVPGGGEIGRLGASPTPVRTPPAPRWPAADESLTGAAPATPVPPVPTIAAPTLAPSTTQSFPGRSGEHRNGTGKPTRTPPGKAK